MVCCVASCFVSRQLASVHWLSEVMRDTHLLLVFYYYPALAFSGYTTRRLSSWHLFLLCTLAF